MSPRRQQTTLPPEQPVRLYKMIAGSFLLLAVLVLVLIGLVSTKRATITIETKAEPIDATGTVIVSARTATGTWPGVVTSTLVSYTGSISPTSGREEDAIATGSVILHNDTPAPQTLVATTRLLSPDGVLFRMKTLATIPAHGTVPVAVYADKPGAAGNIGPTKFTIPGLAPEKQAVIYADSSAAMSGGTKHVGIFTDDDRRQAEQLVQDQLLEAGKQSLAGLVNGQGAVYALIAPVVQVDSTVGSSTDHIAISGKGTVQVVAYPKDAVKQYVSDILTKRAVDDTELIEASHDDPAVSIDQINVANQTAELKITSGGVAALNPESQQLQKTLFFGKTKDDVRRYVLSLDHVHGVDITFEPAWMLTVPTVADHVSVVVKRIE